MGQLLPKPMCSILVNHLRTLKAEEGDTVFNIRDYDLKFDLNQYPGLNKAPKVWIQIINTSIKISQDLSINKYPLRAKASKVTIDIERIIVYCGALNYNIDITGKLTFFDAYVKILITPKYDRGIRIANIKARMAVERIKPEIEIRVNNTNHSELANILLNIDNPHLASGLLNAIFVLSKGHLIKWLNTNLREIAMLCGIHLPPRAGDQA